MAALSGTIVASRIVPSNSLDAYATHDADYGRGGYRSVVDISFIFLVLNGKRGHSKFNTTMIMFFYGIISCLKFHIFTSFHGRLDAAGVAYKKRTISVRSSFF